MTVRAATRSTADADPESQGRDDRDGKNQERDQLPLGRWIEHTQTGDQPDDGTEQHGDSEEIVIGHRHAGGSCRGGGVPSGRLQRTGEVHEDPLGRERRGDGQRALRGKPKPVQTGIGADEGVDPPVSDALWSADRGRPRQPGWLDDRGHEPIVTSI